MAHTAKWYGPAAAALASGGVNWGTDTIKVMLTTSAYVPDQDTHQFKTSVTNEVTGTGYTAGGATLASKTSTYTAGTNTQALDAADVSWAASTITGARNVVIYKDTGTAATSPLLGYVALDADFSSSNGALTIQWDTGGVLALTVT